MMSRSIDNNLLLFSHHPRAIFRVIKLVLDSTHAKYLHRRNSLRRRIFFYSIFCKLCKMQLAAACLHVDSSSVCTKSVDGDNFSKKWFRAECKFLSRCFAQFIALIFFFGNLMGLCYALHFWFYIFSLLLRPSC